MCAPFHWGFTLENECPSRESALNRKKAVDDTHQVAERNSG